MSARPVWYHTDAKHRRNIIILQLIMYLKSEFFFLYFLCFSFPLSFLDYGITLVEPSFGVPHVHWRWLPVTSLERAAFQTFICDKTTKIGNKNLSFKLDFFYKAYSAFLLPPLRRELPTGKITKCKVGTNYYYYYCKPWLNSLQRNKALDVVNQTKLYDRILNLRQWLDNNIIILQFLPVTRHENSIFPNKSHNLFYILIYGR